MAISSNPRLFRRGEVMTLDTPTFESSRKAFVDMVTGDAKKRIADLLVVPKIPVHQEWKVYPGKILAANAAKTRPGLSTLHDIVHSRCITDLTREQLEQCNLHGQLASILRHDTNESYVELIQIFGWS